ncbi:GNAT family N-acetyltransferase [Agromyces albus]|uniref:GNAT family N-acetyltransferase n=1 Tax=Agromyces albus TaxID=205332 RepID=A0A4Q2L4D5_9MICO|nr:GNAT family N-acetyltransferase [Agromyces albus]RXZ73064.1 GNAT family N-acetyltransferase [Agromyces albus]
MSFDLQDIPLDSAASAAIAAQGLEYRLLDPGNRAALAAWIQADVRGFHRARPRKSDATHQLQVLTDRRVLGVYDPKAADRETPVATVSGWPAGLTVPGGRSVDAWAVSSVTVSPTHRRRGIARALMAGSVADARAAGAALAMLTATEATIYGRFGYAPAAQAATITIDRPRVRWIGPAAPGRLELVEPAELRNDAAALVRRAVARTPGEIDRWPGLLDRVLGLIDLERDFARATRVVRYDDEDGQPQGFVTYRITRELDEPGILDFDFLVAATDDAERALWRFLVEQDFVTAVRGRLRSIDEPVAWLLEDPRAITVSDVVDHLWVRVLDPVAALSARVYGATGTLTLEIADPDGPADGTFELEVAGNGRGELRRVDDTPSAPMATPTRAAPSTRRSRPSQGIRLGVQELGAIYLGGVRPSVLARAGRLAEVAPGSIALADRMFASERTPHLSIWF